MKRFEESASLVGQQIAEQLEKRIPFRRALKGMIDQVTQNKDILGVKIEISGRLGGAEMRRREWLSKGKIPLHTLRADIDFARVEANTTYGVIGIKVWIYKGEKFEEQSTE
jgi:small subunit ribosomal protein S3